MAPARADGTRGPRIALALALVFEALGRAGSIGDSDGWWHFRTGKLILATHAVPRTDPYSWTAPGERWHPNAWLSDTVYALVRRAGGLAGIAWLRTLFVPAFGLALHGLARVRGARPWPSAVVAAVGTLAIYPFVAERPQLFSFLLLPAVIVVTERALSGSARALTLLGVLFVLWANLHGVFVTGVAIVGLMAAGRAVHDRTVLRPALVIGVCVVAGLVNPFGVRAYIDAAHVRAVSGPIQEWRDLDLSQGPDEVLALLTLASVGALVGTGRWRRLDVVLPIAAIAAATTDAIRNGPLLVVLIAPELALGLGAINAPRLRSVLRRRAPAIVTGLGVAWVVLASGSVHRLGEMGDVTARDFPVHAVTAIPRGCRLLNEYDLGGYVIDRRFGDGVRVSQDGRNDLYGLPRLRAQQRVLRGLVDPPGWLRRHRVECVLAHRGRRIVRLLDDDPAWRRVASDPSGVLFVRVVI